MTPAPGRSAGGEILLRIGQRTCAISAPDSELRAFAVEVNAKRRLPGVPDALNPDLLDAGKLAAFAAAVRAQPEPVRARLAGHGLLVDGAGIGILAIEPVTEAAYTAPLTLEITDNGSINLQVSAKLAPDAALAQTRASAAQAAFADADRLARDLEATRPATPASRAAAADARFNRFAIARTWRLTSSAWAIAAPSEAAQASHTAAEKAAKATAMATGVPRP